MCGRYHLDENAATEMERLLAAWDKRLRQAGAGAADRPALSSLSGLSRLREARRNTDICPSQKAPVLVERENCLRAEEYRWGFPGPERGLLINARSETALEKKTFQESVQNRRCLIPASGFYEWNARKEKFYFTGGSGKQGSSYTSGTSGLLLMVGIYRRMEDEERFVILTTQANASVRDIHPRMPLILSEEDAYRWLVDRGAAQELLQKEPEGLKKEQEGQLSFFFLTNNNS